MKFNILKDSRRGRLKSKIRLELAKAIGTVNVERILDCVDQYEKDNLDTINHLKKEKIITTKRINGGLKQCINDHGPITKILIGSATKRIYGSLLGNIPKKTPEYSSSDIFWKAYTIITTIYIIWTLWK
jgi:hypothetical protein